MLAQNSTISNDANSTISNDANVPLVMTQIVPLVMTQIVPLVMTQIVPLVHIRIGQRETNPTNTPGSIEVTNIETNSTGAEQAAGEETNGTNYAAQSAIVSEGASSEQASKTKAEVKKVDNPITALNKNFTIDKNNASEVSSVNNPPFAIEQTCRNAFQQSY